MSDIFVRFTRRTKELVLFLVLVLSGCMGFYLNHIGPREKARHSSPDEVKGPLGDLYAPWRGARELLLHHRDPYSPEVAREIQTAYYGKALTGSPHEPRDQQRFAYPVYVSFLLSPLVYLPFGTVQAMSWWIFPALVLVTIPAWLRLVGLQTSLFLLVVIAPMTITAIPVYRGLNLQQLTLLEAGLLAACAAFLVSRYYLLAGILLALASAKPQVSILLSVWLMLWVMGNWPERKRLFWGFFLTLTVLVLSAEYVLPGWIPTFIKGLIAYRQYAGGGNLSEVYFPSPLSWILVVALSLLAVVVCWRTRRQPCDTLSFAFTFCVVLVVSVFVVPALAAVFSQVLFLPALLLPIRTWQRMWNRDLRSRAACLVFGSAILLPWVCAVVVVLIWWLLPISALDRVWGLPLYACLPWPFATIGFLIFMLKDVFEESRLVKSERLPT
jgi:hypothetical protein